MTKRWLAVFGLIFSLLLAPSVLADPPQGHGKGKNKEHGMKDKDAKPQNDSDDHGKGKHADKDKGKGHDHDMDDDDDDGKWERREGAEWRTYGRDEGTPPGWSKGKKVGWKNCGLPPGQAKKTGSCRSYSHNGRRYYYYRDDDGRIIVRRPQVTIRTP